MDASIAAIAAGQDQDGLAKLAVAAWKFDMSANPEPPTVLMETERKKPLLAKAFYLNYGKTRRLAVELAGNTKDDEIMPFREALINVEKYSCKSCNTDES